MEDKFNFEGVFTVTKYDSEHNYEKGSFYEKNSFRNLALNEGITALLNLLIGGAETAFNNANAYIGVGDSNTAAAATQTGLQAVTNKAYVGMEATYPLITDQTVTFRSVFDGSTANFSWQELTVANGNSDAADNLNRAISNQGSKVSGQIWTIDFQITIG